MFGKAQTALASPAPVVAAGLAGVCSSGDFLLSAGLRFRTAHTTMDSASKVQEPVIPTPYEDHKKSSAEEAVSKLFDDLSAYLSFELRSADEDLSVLQSINDSCSSRYSDMMLVLDKVRVAVGELQARYKDLEPYFLRIDAVESATSNLERVVFVLDDYTRSLERKFNQLYANIYRADKSLGPPSGSSSVRSTSPVAPYVPPAAGAATSMPSSAESPTPAASASALESEIPAVAATDPETPPEQSQVPGPGTADA